MNKIYQRIDWENYPSSATPLNEDNLNKMDYAIDKLDDRIVTHETTKLNTATGNTLVKNVTFNEKTGVFTIEKLSGSKITINTALGKISTNFHFNPTTQKLVLTLIDGTVQEIDLSALITQYEFSESDTITFEIDASGKVKANILNGSITGEKLEPNYLANIKVEVAKAESASLSADTSAKNAKTSETNSKTSEEKAREYAEAAGGIDALISSFATGTNPTIQDSTNAPLIYGKFKGYTLQDGEPAPDNPVEINGLAKDGAIEVKTCGKNLLKSTVGIATRDGVTFTISDDGSVALNGTTNGGGYTRCYTDLNSFFNEDGKFGWMRAGKTYRFSIDSKNSNIAIYGLYNTFTNTDIYTPLFEPARVTVDVTIPKNAYKIVLRIVSLTGDGYTHDNDVVYPMIHSVEITDDTYEPYTETTATIPTDAPLYEGDYLEVYADGTGVLHRKMASVVFDGSSDETWSIKANDYVYTITPMSVKKMSVNLYSEYYTSADTFNANLILENKMQTNGAGVLVIGDKRFSTVEEYKSWLQSNPVTVVYELAESTETPLTAEQVAEFKKLYTFEPVTNVLCEGETEIQYYKNTPSGVAVGTVHKMANDNKATYDGDGNVITDTYAKQTDLEKVIDGTTTVAKATSATTATKATQDADGNNIVNTYAKKSSVLSTLTECEASTTDTDIAGASALAELNDSLKTPNYESVTIDEYTTTIYYRKVLNMVELNIVGGSYHIQPESEVILFTLPEEYRPKRGFPVAEGYGKPDVRFYIGGNGVVLLKNAGTQPKSHVAAHCAYLV